MKQTTPPTPPDPHDYAHPSPPDDTHLWDSYGVAQVLGIGYKNSIVRGRKEGLPYKTKQFGAGPETFFYSLESIIEWDRKNPCRRLDDKGRRRKVIDGDGRVWIDGKPAYTPKQVAEHLDISHGAFRQRVFEYRRKGSKLYEPAYKTYKPDTYYTQDQVDAIERGEFW